MSSESDPAWVRIAGDLSARIRTGELEVGHKVPSREALRDQYDVAGGTARRAIDHLRSLGILEGSPGRGVFVKRVPLEGEATPRPPDLGELRDRIADLERLLAEAPTREEVDELKQRIDVLYRSAGLDESVSSATPRRKRA